MSRNAFVPQTPINVPGIYNDYEMGGIVREGGVPVDITSWTFKAQARPEEGATLKLLDLTITIDPDQTANKGKYVISFTSAQMITAAMTTGEYWWDMLVTPSGGLRKTWTAGPFRIGPSITQPGA